MLLLRHEPTGVDVDLSLAWLPFELEALARAETIDLARTKVRAARPEDLVIYKAIAWRPQDQQDVERLVAAAMPSGVRAATRARPGAARKRPKKR